MATKRPVCRYGKNCYRMNPQHQKEYRHDIDTSDTPASKRSDVSESSKKGNQATLDAFFVRTAAAKTSESKQGGSTSPSERRKREQVDSQSESEASTQEEKSATTSEPRKRSETLFDFGVDSSKKSKVGDALDEATAQRLVNLAYNVRMPDDFWSFLRFCVAVKADSPLDALQDALELRLVGPFELAANQIDEQIVKSLREIDSQSSANASSDTLDAIRVRFARYFRYFYDPPEFQTLIISRRVPTLHFGYVRDDPREMPVFCASNDSSAQVQKDAAVFTRCGTDLFELLAEQIDNALADARIGLSRKRAVSDLQAALERFCATEKIALPKVSSSSNSSSTSTSTRPKRTATKAASKSDLEKGTKVKRNVVCTLWNGLGLSVPVHNNVGYRPVPESATKLRNLFDAVQRCNTDAERSRAMEPIYELVTLCQFANDEGDYGEALELGLNVLASGCDALHATALNLLPLAYQLAGREWFARIVRAHLERRTKRYEELAAF